MAVQTGKHQASYISSLPAADRTVGLKLLYSVFDVLFPFTLYPFSFGLFPYLHKIPKPISCVLDKIRVIRGLFYSLCVLYAFARLKTVLATQFFLKRTHNPQHSAVGFQLNIAG